MTLPIGVVVAGLVLLAAADGALSGFRSAQGRTGLIDHRRADTVAQLRGLALVAVLLLPTVVLVLVDGRWSSWAEPGTAMLLVLAPYGVLVLLALLAYLTLTWRLRYLATALILGPFTFARPAVAVAGGAAGVLTADRGVEVVAVVLAVAGVLAVGPLCDRWEERAAVS